MADKLLGKHIGQSILRMLHQELGELGQSIYNKQCSEIGIKPEDVKPGDLVVLSQRMIRALRPTMGDDKANKIGKEILKFKILAELEEVRSAPSDPQRARKEMEAYSKLASICYTIGDWNDSMDYCSKVITMGKAIGDHIKVAEAYRTMGHIAKLRSEWDKAIELLNQSIAISTKMKQPIGVADAQAGLGYVYWRMGEYEKAKQQLETAVRGAEQARDKAALGVIHIEIGLVYGDTGELDKSVKHYKVAIDLLKEVKDLQQLSRAYNNLGDIYLQMEEWKRAIECFDQCKAVAETINHRRMIGWSLFNSGEAYARIGKHQETVKRCTEALEVLGHLNDYMGLSAAHRCLGLAYRLSRDWEKSESHFKQTKDILKSIDSPFNHAHLALEWGMMCLDKGDKKRGRELLGEAAATFKTIGAKRFLDKTERILDDNQ